MRLPRLLVLTDRAQARRPLAEVVRAALGAGAPAVVLREKDLPPPQRTALAAEIAAVVDEHAALLLVAGPDVSLAAAVGAAGVHLAAADAWPAPDRLLVGRSCHDEAELRAAARRGAAFATVSPTFPTTSKPGYGPPLDTTGLTRLAASTPLPVFALGGVTAANAPRCLAAGAHGVAVMGEVMRADDPAAAVGALVAAVDAGP